MSESESIALTAWEAGNCPYLGVAEDAQTCLAYPSRWNVCHHARSSLPVHLEYQRQVCLSGVFSTCPVYKKEHRHAPPARLRVVQLLRTKLSRRTLWLLVPLLLLGITAWLLGASPLGETGSPFPVNPVAGDPAPVSSSTSASAPSASPGLVPIPVSSPPTESPVAIVPPQPTTPVPAVHCGYALEQPIAIEERKVILHRVAYGENMNLLAERYATSIQAILDINYFIPSPLWSELVIVIPLDTQEVADLPVLEPFWLAKESASLQQVADQAALELPALLQVNQLDPGCSAYTGWVLVPRPEKINP
jgi:hypothetical protein